MENTDIEINKRATYIEIASRIVKTPSELIALADCIRQFIEKDVIAPFEPQKSYNSASEQ